MDEVRKNLLEALEETGLSMSSLSQAASLNHAYVFQFLNHGTPRVLPERRVKQFAEMLGITEERLRLDKNHPLLSRSKPANFEPLRREQGRDLPIKGVTAGTAIASFDFTGKIIDYAVRPSALAASKGAYALYVTGDSMQPVYKTGDLVIVQPTRPAAIGDDVIIQIQDFEGAPIRSYIKRLVDKTTTMVTCRQYNPDTTTEFKVKTVVAAHKVLRISDLFG